MYRDYVVVTFDCEDNKTPMLFQAPNWSHLKEGGKVIADGRIATVVASDTLADGDTELEFFCKAFGVKTPIQKLEGEVRNFVYEGEDDAEV